MTEADTTFLDSIVGCQITLRTTFEEEVSGSIFAYDRFTNSLLLKQEGGRPGTFNLRLLKTNYIKEIVSATRSEEPIDLKLPPIDLKKVQEREDKALRAAEAEVAKIGVGVTKEAQAVFDALSKTMPCRWQDKNIVVLEEVYICPPYKEINCSADDLLKPTLQRVRKVLNNERTRLGLMD